jgi:hypothetical protein
VSPQKVNIVLQKMLCMEDNIFAAVKGYFAIILWDSNVTGAGFIVQDSVEDKAHLRTSN